MAELYREKHDRFLGVGITPTLEAALQHYCNEKDVNKSAAVRYIVAFFLESHYGKTISDISNAMTDTGKAEA